MFSVFNNGAKMSFSKMTNLWRNTQIRNILSYFSLVQPLKKSHSFVYNKISFCFTFCAIVKLIKLHFLWSRLLHSYKHNAIISIIIIIIELFYYFMETLLLCCMTPRYPFIFNLINYYFFCIKKVSLYDWIFSHQCEECLMVCENLANEAMINHKASIVR